MITATVQRFDAATLSSWTGPDVQARLLADAAADILEQTGAANAAAFGGVPTSVTTVDGSATSDLSRVRPQGTIDRVYDVMPAVLKQIGDWLWQHSPVKTGRYRRSHQLLAGGSLITEVDGADWSPPAALPAGPFTFASVVAYAEDIEPHDGKPGESRQAPDGVYQVIAALGSDAFGALATIHFDIVNDEPAIQVVPK
jgi:hypothetical protein